jgi:hypothetical protein
MCVFDSSHELHHPRQRRIESSSARPRSATSFADSRYLHRVIGHLKHERIRQGLSVREVARRSRIRKGAIDEAEKNGEVLNSRDFKAWSNALGIPWDQVWSDCLPRR